MAKDLQNLQLPPFVIADFYRDSLVESLEQPVAPTIAKPIEVPLTLQQSVSNDPNKKMYLGNNAKNIAVVVKDSNAVFLNDEQLQFLGNILGACKLNLGDIAIINYLNTPADYSVIHAQTQCKFLLLFDTLPSALKLPFNIPYYQVFPHAGCTFLSCPDLSAINGTSDAAKLEKSKLWVCLKKMFGI